MIDPSLLGVKYYNLKRVAAGGNTYEGMSEERLEQTKDKMRSKTGARHHRSKVVIIDGTRYESITAASKALGMNVQKRVHSKLSMWKGHYFEEAGPPSEEEMAAADSKKKESFKTRNEKMNSSRTYSGKKEEERVSKIVSKRRETGSYKGRPVDVVLIPVEVDGKWFPNFASAARALCLDKQQVRNRAKSKKYENYTISERKSA